MEETLGGPMKTGKQKSQYPHTLLLGCLGICFLLTSCATPAPHSKDANELQGPSAAETAAGSAKSSVVIEYTLGRDHYKFTARATESGVIASSFLDKQLLKKGQFKT